MNKNNTNFSRKSFNDGPLHKNPNPKVIHQRHGSEKTGNVRYTPYSRKPPANHTQLSSSRDYYVKKSANTFEQGKYVESLEAGRKQAFRSKFMWMDKYLQFAYFLQGKMESINRGISLLQTAVAETKDPKMQKAGEEASMILDANSSIIPECILCNKFFKLQPSEKFPDTIEKSGIGEFSYCKKGSLYHISCYKKFQQDLPQGEKVQCPCESCKERRGELGRY